MRLSKRIAATALAAVMAVSVLTACGGSKPNKPGSSSSTSGKPASSSSSSSSSSSASSKPASSSGSTSSSSSAASSEQNISWQYSIVSEVSKAAMLTGYDASRQDAPKGNVVIPSSVDGYKIVAIDKSAFEGNKSITSVEIPSTVWFIGDYAFRGCTNLKTVVMQENGRAKGVHSVDMGAFADCVNLTKVQFTSGLEIIATAAFNNCLALKSIVIPENSNGIETDLQSYSFRDCRNLVRIYIPRSVKKVDCPFDYRCKNVSIYYQGSEEEWNQIEGIENKTNLVGSSSVNVTVYYNCTPDAVTGA